MFITVKSIVCDAAYGTPFACKNTTGGAISGSDRSVKISQHALTESGRKCQVLAMGLIAGEPAYRDAFSIRSQ